MNVHREDDSRNRQVETTRREKTNIPGGVSEGLSVIS